MIIRTMLLMLACGVVQADAHLVTDVTVLPMTGDSSPGSEALPGRDVLIVDGRIERIAKSIREVPEDARRIDGRDKYLMPGLWDLSADLSGDPDAALPNYLANGVIGVCDADGDPVDLQLLGDAVACGERVGPRIVNVAAFGGGLARGSSLHEHLAEEVMSGHAEPSEVLSRVTIEAARRVQLDEDLGTVETGKLADLVLLTRNPLENIAHSRSIAGVFRAGAYFDAYALRNLCERAAEPTDETHES